MRKVNCEKGYCVGVLITVFRFTIGRALIFVLSKAFHFYGKNTSSNQPGVSMTRKMVSVTICTDKRRQTRPQTSKPMCIGFKRAFLFPSYRSRFTQIEETARLYPIGCLNKTGYHLPAEPFRSVLETIVGQKAN